MSSVYDLQTALMSRLKASLDSVSIDTAPIEDVETAATQLIIYDKLLNLDTLAPGAVNLLAGMTAAQLEAYITQSPDGRTSFEAMLLSDTSLIGIANSASAMTAIFGSATARDALFANVAALTRVLDFTAASEALAQSSISANRVLDDATYLDIALTKKPTMVALFEQTDFRDKIFSTNENTRKVVQSTPAVDAIADNASVVSWLRQNRVTTEVVLNSTTQSENVVYPNDGVVLVLAVTLQYPATISYFVEITSPRVAGSAPFFHETYRTVTKLHVASYQGLLMTKSIGSNSTAYHVTVEYLVAPAP